jgi:hypothetical protein
VVFISCWYEVMARSQFYSVVLPLNVGLPTWDERNSGQRVFDSLPPISRRPKQYHRKWRNLFKQIITFFSDSTLMQIHNHAYSPVRGSRGSSSSIVSDYGLDDRAIGVRFPAGAKDFFCILCVQTGSGAHPASCTMGTGGPFPGGKSAAGAWRWPHIPI